MEISPVDSNFLLLNNWRPGTRLSKQSFVGFHMFSRLRRSRSAASRPIKTPSARQARSTCSKSSLVPAFQRIKRENETEFGATFSAFLALLACYCTKLFLKIWDIIRSFIITFVLPKRHWSAPGPLGWSVEQTITTRISGAKSRSFACPLVNLGLTWMKSFFVFVEGRGGGVGGNVSWHVLHKEGKMINVNKSAESPSCDDAETSTF